MPPVLHFNIEFTQSGWKKGVGSLNVALVSWSWPYPETDLSTFELDIKLEGQILDVDRRC
jgi:hypothetical protein